MPDEGHCVPDNDKWLLSIIVKCHYLPEHKGGVDSCLGGIHVVSSVLALADLHLHELENIFFYLFVFFAQFYTFGMLSAKEMAVTGMM